MKKWKIREQVSENLEEQLLSRLGIENEEQRRRFFEPDYEKDLHDPLKILNMKKAVKRILSAIRQNDKIIVYGDYDADGVCACAIFYDFFKKIGFENFETYIPDRHKEGYGLNMGAVTEFVSKKINLVITLDCGISDYEEVKKLNAGGVETIIIDHHLESGELPPTAAIVDPKQEKDKYPFKMLAGAGVAFKTVQALIDKGGFTITPGWGKWLLDLVAIATVADMVPLADENRALVFYGLKVLQKTSRPGLLAFYKRFNINPEKITEDDIAFTIAPRINIASRMDHANASFSLLTTQSSEEASWISQHLDDLNFERRLVVDDILKEVGKRMEEKKESIEIVVEGDSSWNVGVLGLTANRLLEKYHCPVCLWGQGTASRLKGSCRSDGSVNLVDLMRGLPGGILSELGGHAFSAGFSLEEEKLKDFEGNLREVYKKIKKDVGEDIFWIDKEMELNDLSENILATIEKFGPFGVDNKRPVFLFKNLSVMNVRMFGNGGIHLQLDFKKNNGQVISAVGFFMNSVSIKNDDRVDLVASVERNTFNGRNELRLRIIDFKIL